MAAVGAAVAHGAGFAGGKIGFSEQHWLQYPAFLESAPDARQRRAFEMVLRYHFRVQSGVYPADSDFARAFAERYAEDLRQLDWLGIFGAQGEASLVRYHRLPCRLLHFRDMEPDRSSPANESLCYLRHFAGLRLLLVAPFADLLRQRATRETFEAVWSRTGKPWFEPARVMAVEFPYGFEERTRSRFPTVWDLRDHIAARIDAMEYDVALIAAGGLGIPLAAHVKRTGRIGISLGGHLQVLFGVLGSRWRNIESWRRRYFNEHWIDMPERYRPANWQRLTDNGAYW